MLLALAKKTYLSETPILYEVVNLEKYECIGDKKALKFRGSTLGGVCVI
jgi:hypothetical protein